MQPHLPTLARTPHTHTHTVDIDSPRLSSFGEKRKRNNFDTHSTAQTRRNNFDFKFGSDTVEKRGKWCEKVSYKNLNVLMKLLQSYRGRLRRRAIPFSISVFTGFTISTIIRLSTAAICAFHGRPCQFQTKSSSTKERTQKISQRTAKGDHSDDTPETEEGNGVGRALLQKSSFDLREWQLCYFYSQVRPNLS